MRAEEETVRRNRISSNGLGASGLSVVELVIASSILITVLTSTMGVVVFASNSGSSTAKRGAALNIANAVIERARNMPFDDVGVRYAGGGYGEPPGEIVTPDTSSYPGFTVSTSITWVNSAGRAAYKEMSVTVAWSAPAQGSVTLETGIFGATELVNVGDLRVTVIDADSGTPLFRTTVRVDPYDAASERASATDAKGIAYFGRVGQGPAKVTLTLAGYVFDPADTAAVSIDKDLVRDITVYGRRSSSLRVTVRDSVGPISGATVTLTDSRGKALSVKTGGDGAAPAFIDLLVGSYGLDISTPGGRKADQTSVTVSQGGQTLLKDVILPAEVVPGQVQLSVRDKATAQPLSGATVRLYSSAGTEVNGTATATVAGQVVWSRLVPGAYTVSASLNGYTAVNGITVSITAGQSAYATLDMVAIAATTGTIRALVRNSIGIPVSKVRVYIKYPGSDGRTYNAKTDSVGVVSWGSLPMGSYTLWVEGQSATQQAAPGSPYTALTFVKP